MIAPFSLDDIIIAAQVIRKACYKLHGTSEGHCREAAILLVEYLFETTTISTACVCTGQYHTTAGPRGHTWVRLAEGCAPFRSILVDPTADQFLPSAGVIFEEVLPYQEESYLYFCKTRLADLRKLIKNSAD